MTGVQLLLETSDDRRTWSPVPASLQKISDIDANTARAQLVDDGPLTSRTSRFYRLGVRIEGAP